MFHRDEHEYDYVFSSGNPEVRWDRHTFVQWNSMMKRQYTSISCIATCLCVLCIFSECSLHCKPFRCDTSYTLDTLIVFSYCNYTSSVMSVGSLDPLHNILLCRLCVLLLVNYCKCWNVIILLIDKRF